MSGPTPPPPPPATPSPRSGGGGPGPQPSSPSPARRRAVALLAALLWPAVLVQYLLILPGFDKQFREHGLKVDDLTGLALNVSAWLRARVVVAFAVTFGLTAVTVGTVHAVQTAPLSGRRRVAFLLFAFGVPCLVFLLTFLTVENTRRTLFEGLRK